MTTQADDADRANATHLTSSAGLIDLRQSDELCRTLADQAQMPNAFKDRLAAQRQANKARDEMLGLSGSGKSGEGDAAGAPPSVPG